MTVTWTPEARASVRLHTIPGAAGRLGCSADHVYRLIARGVLPAVDIAVPGARRSKTRVRDDDLAAYIDARTRRAGGDGTA
jgi:excisionase family DNA binding protein